MVSEAFPDSALQAGVSRCACEVSSGFMDGVGSAGHDMSPVWRWARFTLSALNRTLATRVPAKLDSLSSLTFARPTQQDSWGRP